MCIRDRCLHDVHELSNGGRRLAGFHEQVRRRRYVHCYGGRSDEMCIRDRFYGVTTDYLLGVTENKKRPDAVLSDLHLSDGAVDVLRLSLIHI